MLYNEVTENFEKSMKGRTQMYQLLDLNNLNLEEAVQLCKQEYRGQGIAKQILNEVVKACMADGMQYLGVDCETINPTALHFWPKYFHPYTYPFIRRFDERIYGYEVE